MMLRSDRDTNPDAPKPKPVFFQFPLGFDEWTEEEQLACCEQIAKGMVEVAGGPEAGGPEKAFGKPNPPDDVKPPVPKNK